MAGARSSHFWKRRAELEPILYAVVAGVVTLLVALRFYGSVRLQTLHALHWASPDRFDQLVRGSGLGPWSAPLDDVFIHFDFARSTARGYPFQWSEGNGYSSGGTSLLYPFVLAFGYWIGFRGLSLMEWAALLACVCTFAVLLAARRLTAGLPRSASYLLPFGFLCVGAFDWSLFSGMEVALFLALWAAAYLVYDNLVAELPLASRRESLRDAGWLGASLALVTATRPEGVAAAVVLTFAAALAAWKLDRRRALEVAAIALSGPFLVLVLQQLANRVFTGESTAAGALVKLEAHHPFLDASDVWAAWWFHVKYQVLRVTQYHFGDQPVSGWIAWGLAFAALVVRRTRRPAAILWASALLWVLLVALNGQVRWQNERYTMPAVGWLLLAATLGTGALLVTAYEQRQRIRGTLLWTATLVLAALFVDRQLPRFREQVWFFGRASRNILEQHIGAGSRMRFGMDPKPSRVLVGDAGAIPYIADVPALDLIGLGGYDHLPFARATRQHVGAGIELIERLAPSDRPDLLAIYPGWWGNFPLWFGTKVSEVPVRGNVICAGASKVLYQPDWSPLDASGRPFRLEPDERVVAVLDHADVLSERQRAYRLTGAPGYVEMKILFSPESRKPVWDAGRIVPPGAVESFELDGLDPGKSLRFVFRAAPTERVRFELEVGGLGAGHVVLEPNGGWVEASVDGVVTKSERVEVKLGAAATERILYHVFVIQKR